MSSNYEFEKFRVKERMRSRMDEAEAHRLTKAGEPKRAGLAVRLIKSLRVVVSLGGKVFSIKSLPFVRERDMETAVTEKQGAL